MQGPGRSRPVARASSVAVASVALAIPLWGAWAGGGPAGASTHSKAPATLCRTLNGIFSDGPDPDADPVGYALSQIRSLGAIHTSDHTLGAAVTKLVASDKAFVRSTGSDRAAKKTIKREDAAVHAACPGVAS